MVGLANDPTVIDGSLSKLVDTVNAELQSDEQDNASAFSDRRARAGGCGTH